ncbi:Ankyrin repeat-containing protein P1E11.10 [Ceratocystis lukuohia]|uniref:Ankyrin repeat-containing protein P1E11.10 n=3 Tax=Ceratocystis TaxID=5157 RepID=A0A0F8CVQ4_CERFI|nr:Ankyrin repeat-containing protein P1E11.10 [Ceratocystis platani]PHH49731.1 Ankyrin repeat-containing protein P1E11.10 [Ceratocystis fimbriata CBS 114723]
MSPNVLLLAADSPSEVVPLLQQNPALASVQDEYGYSLVHAAASYNHLDLLRSLISDFKVSVDILDEDGESALFVVETVETARVLLQELSANLYLRNSSGQTAREKIMAEEEFPEVAEYLAKVEASQTPEQVLVASGIAAATNPAELPEIPKGLKVTMGTMDEDENGEADPTIRALIQELSQRPDFETPEVQAEVRQLVTRILAGEELESIRKSNLNGGSMSS